MVSRGNNNPSREERAARAAARGQSISERNNLINELDAIKHAKYGDSPQFNSVRSRKAVDKDPDTGRKRSRAELKAIIDYVVDGYEPEDSDYDFESALYYH